MKHLSGIKANYSITEIVDAINDIVDAVNDLETHNHEVSVKGNPRTKTTRPIAKEDVDSYIQQTAKFDKLVERINKLETTVKTHGHEYDHYDNWRDGKRAPSKTGLPVDRSDIYLSEEELAETKEEEKGLTYGPAIEEVVDSLTISHLKKQILCLQGCLARAEEQHLKDLSKINELEAEIQYQQKKTNTNVEPKGNIYNGVPICSLCELSDLSIHDLPCRNCKGCDYTARDNFFKRKEK